ncbi:uncharacterized protein LOC132548432 [Ylistrum balloti]|uniref:uncharacterized protein LOC132548432 n=1 Tax=Ylistrum balloti TaxID=509963 RepID=UPI00290583F9|nr:uncharacterized protein LOC132548432 [Ylistrum balloti]
MLRTYLLSCTCAVVLLIACVTDARFLDDDLGSRVKRQVADARMAEVLALLELESRLQRCTRLGCGLIDLESGRKKRDVSSVPNFRGSNTQRILNKILRQTPEQL